MLKQWRRRRRHHRRARHGRAARRVLIVGNPNVGKSAVFNWLTGRYATVSNYPGTTVEVSRGRSRHLPHDAEVMDTPGMYSLLPITDEERVARDMLLSSAPAAVLHVIDAKNIERMLGMTLQLIEARLPVVLALNMSDEADRAGIRIDAGRLESLLGVPVVPTAAITGAGMPALAQRLRHMLNRPSAGQVRIDYGPTLEQALAEVAALLDSSHGCRGQGCGGGHHAAATQPGPPARGASAPGISPRSRALMLLQADAGQQQWLIEHAGHDAATRVAKIASSAAAALEHGAHYHAALAVKAQTDRMLPEVVAFPGPRRRGLGDRLSDLCMNPMTGIPLLVVALYLGLYKFVGEFGAGTLVNWLEGWLFKDRLNPWAERLAGAILPWQVLRDLFVGDFGVVTLGIRYAVAIVLPIVGTFFLMFSIFEDSGYLPLLAMLIDRMFKKIGLSGRAVIPMVLGFGCDTMATMVTRTLETKRERIIATMLLALAIPCSAQMGVILGLLAGHPAALAVWAGILTAVFLLAGLLAAKVLPGRRPSFYMELPPLRLPRPGNVLLKTYTRMVWYFKEVLPLFILASALIWLGRLTGAFQGLIWLLEPVVRALGLPEQSAVALLFGFFRRDYGVAGLYDLHRQGMLAGNQLAVAAVTLTLFLPCVAQLLIMAKERGVKMAAAMAAFIGVFSLAVGAALNWALVVLGVRL